MTYVDLRPHDARPVLVLVDGAWWSGELAAYKREADGTWRGCVQWLHGEAQRRIGWFGDQELALLPRTRRHHGTGDRRT